MRLENGVGVKLGDDQKTCKMGIYLLESKIATTSIYLMETSVILSSEIFCRFECNVQRGRMFAWC